MEAIPRVGCHCLNRIAYLCYFYSMSVFVRMTNCLKYLELGKNRPLLLQLVVVVNISSPSTLLPISFLGVKKILVGTSGTFSSRPPL